MTQASAMILAAGRGERMRPLTDLTPKPLLAVRCKPLMQWPLEALAASGVRNVVVNTAWLGTQIRDYLGAYTTAIGDGALSITYSDEQADFGGALETAGGIVRALPLLADCFWVTAGDVFAPDFTFSPAQLARFAASDRLAHLWLVPNPAHNPQGDFGVDGDGVADADARADAHANTRARADGLALNRASELYTFSTIALYRKALFAPPYCDIKAGNPQGRKLAMAPILRAAMDNRQVSAEIYRGPWTDVGTPERLALLNEA